LEEEEERGKETKGTKGAEATRSKIKPRRGTIATIAKEVRCYDSRLKALSQETTLVLE